MKQVPDLALVPVEAGLAVGHPLGRASGGRDEVELTTAITYEDGRTATMQARVSIEDCEAGGTVHV